jgi:hypothetical protein
MPDASARRSVRSTAQRRYLGSGRGTETLPPLQMLDLDEKTLDELVAFLADFAHDALAFVEQVFPWDQGELHGRFGPEPWQADLLRRLGDTLSPSQAVLEAVASGHGVGKSALVSWIILWAMSTAADTKGVVTANTETQLKTKTWAELAKWYRLFIGRDLFKFEATSLFSVDPDHAKTWRVDMVPWSERNYEAFGGLHNQGRRVFMIFDEASAIPDLIWETAEGFLSDENTERFWLAFGNPTRSIGRFRAAFDDPRWHTTQVDARLISFTNKKQYDEWATAYGDDSDWFRVRVKGVFPRVGSMEFISSWAVAEARTRDVWPEKFEPLCIGVDVARFGDDETVLVVRKGRDARSMPAVRLRGLDTMAVAARVVELAHSLRADAVFIDGGGVGGGVVDRCRQLRLNVYDIQFGGKADRGDLRSQGEVYANKRAEMWGAMRAWLTTGGIEDSDTLAAQLVAPSYGFNARDEIQLERKEDIKKRLAAHGEWSSPDWADALALTFAYPVMPNESAGYDGPHRDLVETDYDPYSAERMVA